MFQHELLPIFMHKLLNILPRDIRWTSTVRTNLGLHFHFGTERETAAYLASEITCSMAERTTAGQDFGKESFTRDFDMRTPNATEFSITHDFALRYEQKQRRGKVAGPLHRAGRRARIVCSECSNSADKFERKIFYFFMRI
jgi:hypothetical protein